MSSIAETPWGIIVLLVLAVVIVGVAVLSNRSRTGAETPSPRPDLAGKYPTSPTPLPPKVDPTYRATAAPAELDPTQEKVAAARTRPPRRIVNCPRCQQAILNDESLAELRVACPICHCKFFLPRDA